MVSSTVAVGLRRPTLLLIIIPAFSLALVRFIDNIAKIVHTILLLQMALYRLNNRNYFIDAVLVCRGSGSRHHSANGYS